MKANFRFFVEKIRPFLHKRMFWQFSPNRFEEAFIVLVQALPNPIISR